jgi:hypothetical protein
MRFIHEIGFTVKIGQEEAYQRWLIDNEAALAAAYPEGVRHIGVFATVYSSEKGAGFYRVFAELDSYAALDRLAAAMKDESSDFSRLNLEASRFGDYDLNAPWSNGLHKAVVDATVFDPPE